MSAKLPVIENEKLTELRNLDPTLVVFSHLVEIFNSECRNRLPEMEKFCSSEDFESLGKVTHRFRSTAYNLGARSSAELTQQIDDVMAKTVINKTEVQKLIVLLNNECIMALKILKASLKADEDQLALSSFDQFKKIS